MKNTSSQPAGNIYLRWPQVTSITGLSRSTIWRHEREGTFPRRHQLTHRTVGWKKAEIDKWLASRPLVNEEHAR